MNSFQNIDWASLAGKAGAAIAIIVVTWIVAWAVGKAIAALTNRVPALQKAGSDGDSIGGSLGKVAGLVIWLIGLTALLNLFNLTSVLGPIQNMLDGILGYLPNIIGAVFVFIVGSILAKIVRQLVETALGALPFDKWLNKAGADKVTGADEGEAEDAGAQISHIIALVLYAMIMIMVAIAALQVLNISSISGPATDMLNTIMNAIPNIIAAAILLGIGVLIARFAGDLLKQLLDGLGVDRALREMDVLPVGKSATPGIAKVAQVAIVLFFAVMAAQMLNFPQITHFLSAVIELGGRVIFGGAIIAVGFMVANILAKMVSGGASQIVKIATIVLFAAMGLQYMGIADSIINLGFGAVVVGGALAAALAFGLGGREVAAQQLQKLQSQAQSQSSTGARKSDPLG